MSTRKRLTLPLDRLRLRAFLTRWLEIPGARLLARLGLTPNVVTLLGLALSGAAAYLAATDLLVPAGVVLLVAGIFDLLDGALARETGRVTSFGALLDSVTDRVSEAAVLLGVLVLALDREDTAMAVLAFLALAGSVLVSYTRARAESLGVPGAVGLMTRPERVLVLALGFFTGQVSVALGVISALALFTTLQRVINAWRVLSRKTSNDGH